MPPPSNDNLVQNLIAHYLASSYPSVLEPFLRASKASLPDPARPPQPDLRTLVEDWLSEQLAQQMAVATIDENKELVRNGSWQGWKIKDMLRIKLKENVEFSVRSKIEGISAANLLSVTALHVPCREFDTSLAVYKASCPLSIVVTSVDKTLKIIDYNSREVDRIIQPHRAAILSFAFHPVNPRFLLTGSMDGTTILTDLITNRSLQTFSSKKFVVRVSFSPNGLYMATASYDRDIVIYVATSSAMPPPLRGDDIPIDNMDIPAFACEPGLRFTEAKRITVEWNPEAILFHPESKYLLYTTRSSHLLYYVCLPSESTALREEWSIKTKSFNPSPMDTHISFTVLNMALHPSGRIVACQTGDHVGNSGERILLYGIEPEESERLACLWTGSEGDKYVLPRMAWLPDGSGLVITSPDGYLHLIALNGENRANVRVHGVDDLRPSSSQVIRDCCVVTGNESEGSCEIISVGYDKCIRISKVGIFED
ncbi:hypothetical protein L204_104398 [Cryptococcus depauperatus]|nr:hypothetical protein L204_04770 [Cryptococcus depauperatus CBS 7855]